MKNSVSKKINDTLMYIMNTKRQIILGTKKNKKQTNLICPYIKIGKIIMNLFNDENDSVFTEEDAWMFLPLNISGEFYAVEELCDTTPIEEEA